jgi:predicted molibdopterin-dependent oxidoreductase YjgC
MPNFAYRITSLMQDNPILPIFRSLEKLLAASGLCIGDGNAIGIESPRGMGECKIFVADRIDPRVVCLYHGFAECNCNVLTDNEAIDPITGSTWLKSSLCKVEKI